MEIYYVDDDEDDRLLVREAVREAMPDCDLHEYSSSPAFMEALQDIDSKSPEVLNVDLIMLDVRMPGKDGFQILRELKFHPRYKQIPVIMFTDDKSEKSVNRAYGMGANAYIVKARISKELKFFLRALELLWEPVRKLRSEVMSEFQQEMMALGVRPIRLLMVEDDPEEAIMALELLQDRVLVNKFDRVGSVQELREYLEGTGDYADRPAEQFPDLILADLMLPGEQGVAGIQWLKQQPAFQKIPVIALTGSHDVELHREAREAGAEFVCTKPVNYRDMVDVLRVVGGMRLSIVKVPHPELPL